MKSHWVRSTALLLWAALVPGGSAWAQAAAGNEWTTPAGTVQGTRFSSLNQINTGNVARLVEDFQFNTRVVDGFEGAPLVVGSTMYVVSPFPHRLFALDLARGGALKWTFDPGAQREYRRNGMEGLQHRPGCGRPDRSAVPPLLCEGPGGEPGIDHLGRRPLAARRQHRVGLAHLRSGEQPPLSRHRQPRRVEP